MFIALLYTLWMTTAVPPWLLGFVWMNKRMLQQLVCRWTKTLVTERQKTEIIISKYMQKHSEPFWRWALKVNRFQPCQTDLNKGLCLVGELFWQWGHFPSLCPNVEQCCHLIHVCQGGFPSGHLEYCAAHTPYVWLPAVPRVVDDLRSATSESKKLTACNAATPNLHILKQYLGGHPIWSPVDRLDHISAVAGRVSGAAETAGAAKVYEFDDSSRH